MNPTLLIMAAGIGTRYGGLKQIEPMGPSGETLMEYGIYDAIRAGFKKAVFLFRDDIITEFEQKYRQLKDHIEVEYAFQEINPEVRENDSPLSYPMRSKPWGTAHAILCAAQSIQEPFAVINADDYYGKSGYGLMADFLKENDPGSQNYAVVGYPIEQTLSPHGMVSRATLDKNEDGLLTHVVERKQVEMKDDSIRFHEGEQVFPIAGGTLVSTNFWGFTPSIFPELQSQFLEFVKSNGANVKAEFFIPSVINNLVNSNRATVKVLTCKDQWMGITYKEDKIPVMNTISRLVADGTYPKSLWGQK